jgi:UDP-glucose 4-epimerase
MVSQESFAERFTGSFISDDYFPKIDQNLQSVLLFKHSSALVRFQNPMQELVVITGGAGFIGSHLAEGFLKNGYAVRVVDNLATGRLANLAGVEGSTDFRKIDIRDLSALTQALEGASVILHHAAISSVPRSFLDEATTYDVNVTGTRNLLVAAAATGVKRVIYASSSAVYGNDTADLQRENTLPAPCSPYGLSKWLGEAHMLKFARTTAMETIALRYFNVFGPRQNLDGDTTAVIPQFIRKLADGVRPVIFGDGSQTRDFTYVDSVVEANLRAAKASIASGTILNIATGTRLSLNSLVELLNGIFGSQIAPVYESDRTGDIKHSRADINLSEKLLGDYNRAVLRDGLLGTARWFLSTSGRTRKCEE